MISITLIVAAADNDVIGDAGALPWRLKSDLQHFRDLTMGKPVVMGRKTYLAIGKALPGRTNIVVSRDPAFSARGIVVAPNLAAALQAARGDALRRNVENIMVIGGGEIFRQAMPHANSLILTRVHMRPAGDVVLPAISEREWRQVGCRDVAAGPGDEASFTILTYARIGAALPASPARVESTRCSAYKH